MKTAVYPGSFDPITLGHVDVIQRTRAVFDQVIVLVANSSEKKYLFSVDERKRLVEESLGALDGVRVESFDGLTVNYLRQNAGHVIIRGIRAVADFEYELVMANMNKQLAPEIETMIIFANPKYHYVASRVIKEVAMLGGDLTPFIPSPVETALREKIQQQQEDGQ